MTESESTSRIPALSEDEMSSVQKEALVRLQAGRGRIPTPYRIWLQSAGLVGPFERLGTFLANDSCLSERERELAVLLIAHHWHGRYVFDAHSRLAARAGISQDLMDAIRAGSPLDLSDPRERCIYEIVGRFQDEEAAPDEEFERAVQTLGHDGIAELLVLIGYYSSVSLAMKLYRVPSPA